MHWLTTSFNRAARSVAGGPAVAPETPMAQNVTFRFEQVHLPVSLPIVLYRFLVSVTK